MKRQDSLDGGARDDAAPGEQRVRFDRGAEAAMAIAFCVPVIAAAALHGALAAGMVAGRFLVAFLPAFAVVQVACWKFPKLRRARGLATAAFFAVLLVLITVSTGILAMEKQRVAAAEKAAAPADTEFLPPGYRAVRFSPDLRLIANGQECLLQAVVLGAHPHQTPALTIGLAPGGDVTVVVPYRREWFGLPDPMPEGHLADFRLRVDGGTQFEFEGEARGGKTLVGYLAGTVAERFAAEVRQGRRIALRFDDARNDFAPVVSAEAFAALEDCGRGLPLPPARPSGAAR